mmetsp:Transcript_22110/g.59656  ORF Transcript_22110/g.59656 Transcript_22110/m.59656 type:complete len:181 (+) Transcript_22110:296-838(+)
MESERLYAATTEEVLEERDAWLHTQTHRKQAIAQSAPPSNADAHDAAPPGKCPRRASCPESLKHEHADHARCGPAPGQGTAGPGRGYTFQYSVAIERYSFDDLPLPSPGVANKTWFEQHGQQQIRTTEYIQPFEARCSALEAELYKAKLGMHVTRSAIPCTHLTLISPRASPLISRCSFL